MNDDNSRNKKIIIFIILDFIILITLVILLIFSINSDKTIVPNNDEFVEIGIPKVKNIITYKEINFVDHINSFSYVFDNNYFWIQNRLYDETGKILVDGYSDINSDILEDKYIYANNNLYSYDGKILLDNIETRNIKLIDNYLVVNENKYYDLNMKLLFDGSNYQEIKDFNGKYAITYKNRNYSLVNSNGNKLLSEEYDNIEKINDECFLLTKELESYLNDFYIYNAKLNKLNGPYAYYSIINENKVMVDSYNGNSEDRTLSVEDDKLETSIINLNDMSSSDINGVFTHRVDSFIFDGKYFITMDYISGNGFKYKIYDQNFKQVNDTLYDAVTLIKDDYLLLTIGSKNTLVNKELNELFSFDYDNHYFLEDVIDFDNNIFIVSTDDNSYLYDLNGKLIYDSTGLLYFKLSYTNYYLFDEMSDDSEACILVDTKSKDNSVKNIDNSFCDELYYSNFPFITKNENEKYYLYDISLKQIFNNSYDDIEVFDTFCIVEIDGYYYIMSYDEKKILEDKFSDYHVSKNNKLFLEKEDGSLYYFNYE